MGIEDKRGETQENNRKVCFYTCRKVERGTKVMINQSNKEWQLRITATGQMYIYIHNINTEKHKILVIRRCICDNLSSRLHLKIPESAVALFDVIYI